MFSHFFSLSFTCTNRNLPYRYSDTGLLIFAFLAFPIVGPGSGLEEAAEQEESGVEKDSGELLDPRSALAVARINWIHSRYGSQIVRLFIRCCTM